MLPQVEYKSIPLKIKDVDTSKRTAVIAHSAYNNIDLGEDRANKGMFKKSWDSGIDDISLYFNHDDEQAPGLVVGVHEDNEFAYTEAKMGTHTLGNDTLIMIQEGIIKKASFGFIPIISPTVTIKNRKIRDLKEVKHVETSVLTKMPMNNKTKIVDVKSMSTALGKLDLKTLTDLEQTFLTNLINSGSRNIRAALDLSDTLSPDSDLYSWVTYFISQTSQWVADAKSNLRWGRKEADTFTELKAHVVDMERFVANTKASDACIQQVQTELTETKNFIDTFDTVTTFDEKPGASDLDEVLLYTKLLHAKFTI